MSPRLMLAIGVLLGGLAFLSGSQLDAHVDKDSKTTIRVYPLKELQAGPTAKVLREIFPAGEHNLLRLSGSDDTNSIVASGPVGDLIALEGLIVRLESVAKERKADKTTGTR